MRPYPSGEGPGLCLIEEHKQMGMLPEATLCPSGTRTAGLPGSSGRSGSGVPEGGQMSGREWRALMLTGTLSCSVFATATERSLLKSSDVFLVRLPAARSRACDTKTLVVHDLHRGAPTPQCWPKVSKNRVLTCVCRQGCTLVSKAPAGKFTRP